MKTKEEIKLQLSDSSIQVQLYGNDGHDGQEVIKGDKAKEHLIKWIYGWIDEAIAEHDQNKTVIKAKALRKKGTDKFYYWSDSQRKYERDAIPEVYTNFQASQIPNDKDVPDDAELIDIEIVIKEESK